MSLAPTLAPETRETSVAISEASPPPHVHEETFLRPRRAARRDWLRAGFFATLGAVLMALLAFVIWRLFDNTLAVLSPFVFGFVLALLLDPLADKLERRGMPRLAAVGIIFVALLLLLVGAIWVIVPTLVNQVNDLAQNGPTYIQGLKGNVDHFLKIHHKIGRLTLPSLDTLSAQISGKAETFLHYASGQIGDFLVGLGNFLIQFVLTLIITFFLLMDIDRLRARLFFLAPEKWRARMGQFGGDIGGVFSDYLRGLLIVCSLYGTATIGLLYFLSLFHHSLAHYALLVGVAAGVLYAVPYVGSLTTALVTFLVAFASATTLHHTGLGFAGVAVAATLGLNQIFDNIITPRVVGGGVGLHPVMAIFALVLGGEMFKIWGMLLSVPVAASIQVILFRLYPKLTAPTPAPFLRAQGVPPSRRESAKIREGDESVTTQNKLAEQSAHD